MEEKLCSDCGMIFMEENFKSSQDGVFDDLIFFERLRNVFASQKPLFIHLDNENGILRYLEKREASITGKFEYVIVKAEIEKLYWDYSFRNGEMAG